MSAPINKYEFDFKLPPMSSYHSTWDDADYEPAQSSPREGRLHHLMAAPWRVITELARRHRAMNELARLGDRELSDLGITRSDIPRIFDADFAAEHASRGLGRY